MERFEKERMEALAARRAEWQDSGETLEERFGPGSFGCHEALHVTHLVVDLIERELVQHSAVLLDPSWFDRIREAQALLYRAYQEAGARHL